jgi:aspartyl-tRNA(Asn)/glutamyl-tRNA(Gln) amidotransferase subunit C
MIQRETVLHVAALASLSLDDDEVTALTKDLAAIVRYVEQLQAVDTTGLAPGERHETTPLRRDEPLGGLSHEDALAQAPRAVDGAFAVPPFASSVERS